MQPPVNVDLIWPFKHKVQVSPNTMMQQHRDMYAWCEANFGSDYYRKTWRHALMTHEQITSLNLNFALLNHQLWPVWLFSTQEDAMLFALTWG
jgi:hypothetical protein